MSTLRPTPTSRDERGLALVELVVVLLILALIAGTAITATEGLVEETHYDTTRATLENVEEAILGPYAPPTTHDDTLLAGFVADVGRLPRLDGDDASALLKELWSKPPAVEAFSVQSPPGDDDLSIPGGWRGPYLHLAFGRPRLFDGWGQPFSVVQEDGAPAVASHLPGRIASLGADKLVGGAGYDEDIGLTIASSVEPVVVPRHLASFRVRVAPASEGGSADDVLVRVYVPVEGRVRAFYQQRLNDADPSHEFLNVPVGPRVVRAYQWPHADEPPPPEDDTIVLSPRCAPVTVRLVSGGVPELVLKVANPLTTPPDGR